MQNTNQKWVLLVDGNLADERAGLAANIFDTFAEADQAASELGWNVEVKPLNETQFADWELR